MHNIKYLFILFVLFVTTDAIAQRNAREHIRKGNKLYADSIYDKASVEYLKSLDKDSVGSIGNYNLGNALLFQNKGNEAIEQYQIAAQVETDKTKLAQIHHNMGVILQGSKELEKAVEVYKQALRENPHDDMTRYNLALAMHQLKQQQQQNQENQQQEQQEEQKEQEQQQEEQNQQQEQETKEQERDQQQQEQQDMSKENAEQLLESAMQDEKEVQEKVQKLMQVQGRKLDKDW